MMFSVLRPSLFLTDRGLLLTNIKLRQFARSMSDLKAPTASQDRADEERGSKIGVSYDTETTKLMEEMRSMISPRASQPPQREQPLFHRIPKRHIPYLREALPELTSRKSSFKVAICSLKGTEFAIYPKQGGKYSSHGIYLPLHSETLSVLISKISNIVLTLREKNENQWQLPQFQVGHHNQIFVARITRTKSASSSPSPRLEAAMMEVHARNYGVRGGFLGENGKGQLGIVYQFLRYALHYKQALAGLITLAGFGI